MRWDQKRVIPISGICDHDADRVRVVVTATGCAVWVPRSEVEFWPGVVMVPEWLCKKLSAYLFPKACAPVKAPATAVVSLKGYTSGHGA